MSNILLDNDRYNAIKILLNNDINNAEKIYNTEKDVGILRLEIKDLITTLSCIKSILNNCDELEEDVYVNRDLQNVGV